ncbi:MAG: hypothetical protein R3324_13235 [Halobacteriales archaeon]|nr:hypothetical protein [Halobacteriales archaeon]
MVGSRTATAAVGLIASLAVSLVVWWYFNTFLLFLLVPFVPFLFRRRTESPSVKTCPTCGFQSTDPSVNFCPRDGSELTE